MKGFQRESGLRGRGWRMRGRESREGDGGQNRMSNEKVETEEGGGREGARERKEEWARGGTRWDAHSREKKKNARWDTGRTETYEKLMRAEAETKQVMSRRLVFISMFWSCWSHNKFRIFMLRFLLQKEKEHSWSVWYTHKHDIQRWTPEDIVPPRKTTPSEISAMSKNEVYSPSSYKVPW